MNRDDAFWNAQIMRTDNTLNLGKFTHSTPLDGSTVDINSAVAISLGGVKNDANKPSMSSIPTEAMWQMGQALGYGAKKYGDNNYRQGMLVSRQLAAAVRHIYQHLGGENIDLESGNTHIGHALASLAMAAYTLANHPNMDDRYTPDKEKYEKSK